MQNGNYYNGYQRNGTSPYFHDDRDLLERPVTTSRNNNSKQPQGYSGEYGAARNHQNNCGGPSRSGPAAYETSKRESAVQRLKRRFRNLQDDYSQVQHELQHYKERVVRTEESHRLEIQRMKKELEYHKRLRLGAEQRTFDLEDSLLQQQRQTKTFDENQSGLIEQSQILISRNGELTYKVKNLEAQVTQLQELQGCLQEQLSDVLQNRDELEAELEHLLEERKQGNDIGRLTLEEEEEEEDLNDT